jgi:hypothetical protein
VRRDVSLKTPRDRGVPRRGRPQHAADPALRPGGGDVAGEGERALEQARSPAVGGGWADRRHRQRERARGRHGEREGLPAFQGRRRGRLVELKTPHGPTPARSLRPIRTTEMARRDERLTRLESAPIRLVSGSETKDLNR